MNRQFYSKRHFDLLSNGPPDTAEAMAERIRYREIVEQVSQELAARFPVLTMENTRQAIDWQETRIKELRSCS